MKQHSDRAIILSRTDYAERDRILTLLCAESGKISVLAKGVRGQKSRLAGGVELLSESDITYVEGRTSLMTLTGARLRQHFGSIVQDARKMNQAFLYLKIINKLSDEGAGQEYFDVLLTVLDACNNRGLDGRVVDIWFNLRVLRLSGSQPNLLVDSEESMFEFNNDSQSFMPNPRGVFSRNDIKALRVCIGSSKPPRLTAEIGSEERLQQLTHTLLQANVLEV